ncbi:hypothetical protein Tco_1097113, partial [Tanacetum coccineum]
YLTDYGMFYFCIADSEHDCREGSEQYVIGVVVAINDIVLFQGGAVKEVRSIVIDDPE